MKQGKQHMHHGVGVIVTNNSRALFYIQQKDDKFPISDCALGYSLFGGKIEEGENESDALKRELEEELYELPAKKIINAAKKLRDFEIMSNGREYNFSVYEAVLKDEELNEIEKYAVKEGKRGVLIKKEDIPNIRFIHNLKTVLLEYVKD